MNIPFNSSLINPTLLNIESKSLSNTYLISPKSSVS